MVTDLLSAINHKNIYYSLVMVKLFVLLSVNLFLYCDIIPFSVLKNSSENIDRGLKLSEELEPCYKELNYLFHLYVPNKEKKNHKLPFQC